MALLQPLGIIAFTIIFTLVSVFVYTKAAGPIPFSVTSVTTQKSDAFSVTGEGKAKLAPNNATVRLGVTADGPTAEVAKNKMNEVINKVTTEIKALGIQDKDIKTENISVYEDFNNRPVMAEKIGATQPVSDPNSKASSYRANTASGNAQTKVSYVNVARSDASTGSTIIASDGTNVDSSNNTNWQFDETLTLSLDSTSKSFGVIQPGSNPSDQTTTLTATSNSSTGYVIYAWCTQAMTETRGYGTISDWTGTNATPTTFSNPSTGFGYTTDDASLTGGTANRFTNGGAKYAGFTHTGPGDPVADRTSASTSVTNTISYRLYPSATAANGDYTTTVVYIIAAAFP
jgi:hypothetical protein